jgi:hypothetical protein
VASKLEIYNRALYHLGERRLASLTESREPRRALDDHWSSGVGYCLESAMWNFAIRAMEVNSSASVAPDFGYTFAFQKPDDWVRTASLSDNERFDPPLTDYRDEVGFWWADSDPLYVTFVSNDTGYGFDLGNWSESFSEFVATRLAVLICERITGGEAKLDKLERKEIKAKRTAVSRDAMNEASKFAPIGTWVTSRRAGSSRPFRRANGIVG